MSFRSNLDVATVDELLANHRPGYSLDRQFYLDEAVFEALEAYVHKRIENGGAVPES